MIIELNKQYALIDNKGYNTNIIWTIESIYETIVRPEEQVSYSHSPSYQDHLSNLHLL